MTTLERIVQLYPLHAQRIVECMHTCTAFGTGSVRRQLDSLAWEPEVVLLRAFLWADTPEGHGYWKALARAEGYGNAQA